MRFKFLFFLLLIFFSFSSTVFSEQEMVRMVYFYPTDKKIDETAINTKVNGVAKTLESFYNGLVFEKSNDEYVIHIVEGQYEAADYIHNRDTSNLFEEHILDEIDKEKRFDMLKDLYLVITNIDPPDYICGRAIISEQGLENRAAERTWAFVYETSGCPIELIYYHAAHELGHAFGLYHDFRHRNYIMSYGKWVAEYDKGDEKISIWRTPYELSDCTKSWLKASRFFLPDPTLSRASPAGVIELSNASYYSKTEELHLSLTGAGVPNLHQVQLCLIPTKILDGFLPEEDSRVSVWNRIDDINKYSLHSCHTFQNNPTNKNQIVFKNVKLGNQPPNNSGIIRWIDTHGNISSRDFSYGTGSDNTPAGMIAVRDASPPIMSAPEVRLRATLKGHTDFVSSLAFSPNGQTLASGSRDDTIRLWNPHTTEHFRTLIGHSNDVTSVAFHPIGTWLASGSWDTTIGVWEVNPGETGSWFYGGNGGFVTSVTYISTGGQRLAWGSEDNAVRVTYQGDSFPDWGSYYKNDGHEHDVSSLAFSPDGRTLASGSWDKTIILWDSPDDYLATLTGHTDFVSSLAFSPNGKILASGSWDKTIILWDMGTNETLLTLSGHTDRVLAVAFSADGRTLASGSDDQTIRLWDVATGQQRDPLLGHTSGVTAVAFSPDRKTLASAGGWDNTVRLWDLSPAPTPAPTVKITPSPVILPSVGENLVVKVDISGVQNVAGYQTTVHFDPTVLRYVNSTNGNYLPTGSHFVEPVVRANQVTLAATSLSGDSDGAGTLATLTFEVVAKKPSSITLSNVMIMEQGLTSIPIIVKDGDVVVRSDETLDVNGDRVIDLEDLEVVSAHFGKLGENQADVNGDGVVDIKDLLMVAGGLGRNALQFAPVTYPMAPSTLTAEDIQMWLSQAQELNLSDATYQKGVAVLQQLLAVLTPKETALLPNYPNPFNPETWVPYQLAEPADVALTIYAVDGTMVCTLSLGHQPIGIYQDRSRAAYWDGKNAHGEPVASGVYFYTLTAGDFTATRRMLIRK